MPELHEEKLNSFRERIYEGLFQASTNSFVSAILFRSAVGH